MPKNHTSSQIKQLEHELGFSLNKLTDYEGLKSNVGYYISEDEITGINLSNRKLKNLPNSLTSIYSLQELYLSENDLSNVRRLSNLKNLTTLFISENNISYLLFLKSLTNLKELHLAQNKITEVQSLSKLTKLEVLDLSENQIGSIAPINKLTLLEELYLSKTNAISYEPLSTLINLRMLYLDRNEINKITFTSNFLELRNLYLGNNEIEDITPLAQVHKLEVLDLSSNRITNIDSLKDLKDLKDLDISENRIKDLDSLTDLENLIELIAVDNIISDLSGLIKLHSLRIISIGKNSVSDLTPIKNLKELHRLEAWENSISDISALQHLTLLSTLDLAFNSITDISSLQNLTNLWSLDLWSNQIIDISPLRQLTRLTGLNLRGNQITDIDNNLKNLKNLVRLDLSFNKITYLPEWLVKTKMDNLDSSETMAFHTTSGYNIHGNPIENVPAELLVKNKEVINDYFKSLKYGSEPINEIKVILLGEGASGKTSLMNYLQGKPYNREQSQTHGINLEEYIPETGVIMKIWDFGGQDIMHHTHQFFLTQKSVYVLVINARENTDTEKWLKTIQVFGGDSPIIIVTNKIDENPSEHENIKYLNTKYPNLNSRYVRISCEKGTGLNEFKDLLTKTINELTHVKTLWGNSWLGVKRELEKMRSGDLLKDYIHFEKYEEICNKYKVSENHRETLITWLHQLGAITYFPDSNLNETNVINPSWLTEAFYSIVNSELVAKNYGRFNISNLNEILAIKKYPKHKYQFLLGLMVKFELCYQIDNSSYLIPDLLNKEEPDFHFNTNSSLKFKYKYFNLLPKAVLPKFMVRRHQEIKDDKKWRTGLVINDPYFESEALIRVDEDDKEISIYVYGQEKRGYLASILSNFESINKIYEGLEYEKLVPCSCSSCKEKEKPHYYKYELLKALKGKRKETHTCEFSFEDVNINELLGVLITPEELEDEIKNLVGKGNFYTKKHLEEGNIDGFIDTIKSLFSSVSYLLFEKNEKAYHTPLFMLLRSIFSTDVRADEIQSKGRADIIINIDNYIYILELKLDGTEKEAIEQIHINKYYEPYLLENKKIILIGINFSSKDRNIHTFDFEVLKNPILDI